MHIGIFAKTFDRNTVEEVFSTVKGHGIRTVQFNLSSAQLPSLPIEIPLGTAKKVKFSAESNKVNIVAISGTFNMIHPERVLREEGLKRLTDLAKFAHGVGIPMITLCTGTRNPVDQWAYHPLNNTTEAWNDLLKSIEQALKVTEPYNIKLGIEPELSNVINSATKARKLLDYFQSDRMKIIMDGANLVGQNRGAKAHAILTEAFDLLGSDIGLAHVKDIAKDDEFVAPGQGDFDFKFYIELFQKVNYKGPLIMHGLHEGQVEESLAFLKKILRRV